MYTNLKLQQLLTLGSCFTQAHLVPPAENPSSVLGTAATRSGSTQLEASGSLKHDTAVPILGNVKVTNSNMSDVLYNKPTIIFHDAGDWGTSSNAPANLNAQEACLEERKQHSSRARGAHGNTTVDHPDAPLDVLDLHAHQAVPLHLVEATDTALELWQELLDHALNDPLLATDNFRVGSELHRQKVRIWQAIAVLASFVKPPHVRPAVEAMMRSAFGANNPPSVKQYLEGVVAGLLLKQPELVEELLLPVIVNYEKNHSGVGSFMLLAGQVAMNLSSKEWQQRIIPSLILAISPWLMCHSHNIRTFSQLITYAILQRYPLDSPLWEFGSTDLQFITANLSFISVNPDLIRLRRNIGEPIMRWSPQGLSHPSRIYTTQLNLAGQGPEFAGFEGAPETLMDKVVAFLAMERVRLRDDMSDRMHEAEYVSSGISQALDGIIEGPQSHHQDFQRKITPADVVTEIADGVESVTVDGALLSLASSGLSELLNQWTTVDQAKSDDESTQSGSLLGRSGVTISHPSCNIGSGHGLRQGIILVATLIDKLPNLAGLARTCEVFRAATLVVPDLRIVNEPAFSSISVTAEQHVPMMEVKEGQLIPWLKKKQVEGYALLGLEQTSESTNLPNFQFPRRCILILGREKEGLPAELLELLEATIEIPQLGLIRSLNVHVSGAIALYEYTRQMQSHK